MRSKPTSFKIKVEVAKPRPAASNTRKDKNRIEFQKLHKSTKTHRISQIPPQLPTNHTPPRVKSLLLAASCRSPLLRGTSGLDVLHQKKGYLEVDEGKKIIIKQTRINQN